MAPNSGVKPKKVKQELDMAEHSARLRALPGGSWEALRRFAIWLAGGVLLIALTWLAMSR